MSENSSKVTADHLRRDAYLYVRQSTLYQVANNAPDPGGRRSHTTCACADGDDVPEPSFAHPGQLPSGAFESGVRRHFKLTGTDD
jgi:hypothetical protein